jgi:DNA gyrase subunit A
MCARHEIEEGAATAARSCSPRSVQQGKNALVEKIAEAAKDKRIEGISDIRDRSNREGVRVVVDLKRDATPEVVLNQLWRNARAVQLPGQHARHPWRPPGNAEPQGHHPGFVQFREEVITRRTKFELNKARAGASCWAWSSRSPTWMKWCGSSGLGLARRRARRCSPANGRWAKSRLYPPGRSVESEGFGDTYRLSEIQVRAILDLRLHRLTALGRDEIGDELEGLATRSPNTRSSPTAEALRVMRGSWWRSAFATPRRSQIAAAADGIDDEDLIEREDMVVTVTMHGYIKRTPLSLPRRPGRQGPLGHGDQGRGCRHRCSWPAPTRRCCSSRPPARSIARSGACPRAAATRGRPMVNLLPLDQGETIATVLPLPEDEAEWGKLNVMFATAKGNVRRNAMDAFANIPSNGKIAMRFDDESEDRLIGVRCSTQDDVLLATRCGKAIRFAADDVREFQSRTSTGVRGMALKKGEDEVISLSILHRVGKDQDEREDYLRFAPWKGEKEGEPS